MLWLYLKQGTYFLFSLAGFFSKVFFSGTVNEGPFVIDLSLDFSNSSGRSFWMDPGTKVMFICRVVVVVVAAIKIKRTMNLQKLQIGEEI